MKRRILLIITTLLIVALGLIGITYLISYKNNSLAKSEYESTNSSIPENIVNTIENETEQALSEIEDVEVQNLILYVLISGSTRTGIHPFSEIARIEAI